MKQRLLNQWFRTSNGFRDEMPDHVHLLAFPFGQYAAVLPVVALEYMAVEYLEAADAV